MIADCNIHNPMASDHEEQPHAHILLTLREIDSEGKWKPKCRKEYILDENGEKIKLKSGNYKSRKVNLNNWNDGRCKCDTQPAVYLWFWVGYAWQCTGDNYLSGCSTCMAALLV